MSSAKETPLGINLNSSLLQNQGLNINPDAEKHMGVSKVNGQYTFGSLVSNTCLKFLTLAINDAYCRGVVATSPAGSSTYDNLISIGSNVCAALGNSKPPTYNTTDPADGLVPVDTPYWYYDNYPATTGYAISGNGYSSAGTVDTTNTAGQGQEASWLPYDMTNPNNSITQWGFIRCYALQSWNEFNWNGGTGNVGSPLSDAQYKNFTQSFDTAAGFASTNNTNICLLANAPEYLKGVYSNMNDLTSADILGVSLSECFGTDCIAAGRVIDLSNIDKFGLPSILLQTIYKNHAMTQSLNVALLSSGLAPDDVINICNNSLPSISVEQEQQIYGSFLVIVGNDLRDILVPLNCQTQGLETLADLLNIKKLFPCSYQSITVPVYNITPGPTNSKTYYPVYENETVSARINSPTIAEQVGTIVPAGDPPIIPKESITTVRTDDLASVKDTTGAGGRFYFNRYRNVNLN